MKLFEYFAHADMGRIGYPVDDPRADDVANGGYDSFCDTEGAYLVPELDGEPMSQERWMHLRFLTEGVEDPNALKAVFVLGAGGSGKGSIATPMLAGRGLKYINQDRHLERMLKAENIPLSQAGSRQGKFKKAQGLARRERDAYAKRRLGLHIEVTGWDYKRIAEPVKRLRKLGYDVYAIIVNVSAKTAKARNLVRSAKGGRRVPDWSIERAISGLQKHAGQYLKLFGKENVIVVNNDYPQDPDHWRTFVAPKLTAAGDKLLARPLKNPVGKTWLKLQRAAKQAATEGRPTLVLPPTLLESFSDD